MPLRQYLHSLLTIEMGTPLLTPQLVEDGDISYYCRRHQPEDIARHYEATLPTYWPAMRLRLDTPAAIAATPLNITLLYYSHCNTAMTPTARHKVTH
jgi:hypothetical protein